MPESQRELQSTLLVIHWRGAIWIFTVLYARVLNVVCEGGAPCKERRVSFQPSYREMRLTDVDKFVTPVSYSFFVAIDSQCFQLLLRRYVKARRFRDEGGGVGVSTLGSGLQSLVGGIVLIIPAFRMVLFELCLCQLSVLLILEHCSRS